MDPTLYEYPSPLEGWEDHEPLSDARNPDGKSLVNPPVTTSSVSYVSFPSPITNSQVRGGFDVHVYFLSSNPRELLFAKQLHTRIRLEFPELRIYPLFENPVGPHPVGMFEVNVFKPAQFGAFLSWLVVNRGPLSALLHPNTGDDERDHTQRATWLGREWPLQTGILREVVKMKREKEGKANGEGEK